MHDRARALVTRVLLRELRTEGDCHDYLHLECRPTQRTGAFIPRRSWFVPTAVFRTSEPEGRALRALLEVVGQLCATPTFHWRDSYAGFWREAFVAPLTCTQCRCNAVHPDPIEYDATEQLLASEGPRFELNVSTISGFNEQIDRLREFLFADPSSVLKKKQARELEVLTRGTRSQRTSPPPRIELAIRLPLPDVTVAQYREFARLLEDFAEHEQQKVAAGGAFRFEITTLCMGARTLFGPIEMEVLGDMVASETSTIQHVLFDNAALALSSSESLRAYQHFLRSAVCSSGDSLAAGEGLQILEIVKAPILCGHLAAVCSALRYRNSLTELSVQWEFGFSPRSLDKIGAMWAWIAFGIFHPDSKAQLDHLGLSRLPLRRRVDMETFESILRTPHPGRQLWTLEHGELPDGAGMTEVAMPPGHRVMVELKAKTKVREFPKPRSATLYETASRETEELEAAVLLEKWVCVVVPAFGLGWVPIASVVSRREVPSKVLTDVPPVRGHEEEGDSVSRPRVLAAANVRGFSRIAKPRANPQRHPLRDDVVEAPFAPDSVDDIKCLLRMIGRALESFEHSLHDMDISEADLAEILDSCPNLRQLNLKENALAGIMPLVDRYRSQQCRVTTLGIDSNAEADRIVAHLAQLLMSPCSRPLQYVQVNGRVDNADHLELLGRALNSNRTLQLLSVYVNTPEVGEVLAKAQTHPNCVLGSKLPASTKRAFLSVIREHTNRSAAASRLASLARMDSSLVAEIFAFAGVSVARSVVW